MYKKRVVLTGQYSSCVNFEGLFTQGFILVHLMFWIYINVLSDNLSKNWKRFADGSFLFFMVRSENNSLSNLKNNLKEISHWDFQWKKIFSPDTNKKT